MELRYIKLRRGLHLHRLLLFLRCMNSRTKHVSALVIPYARKLVKIGVCCDKPLTARIVIVSFIFQPTVVKVSVR